jgi:hypothetical protein
MVKNQALASMERLLAPIVLLINGILDNFVITLGIMIHLLHILLFMRLFLQFITS